MILSVNTDRYLMTLRMEDFPLITIEAQACGTPVVAFDIGGLKDIVEHERTGYLAKAFDTEDLAKGILWVLGNKVITMPERDSLPICDIACKTAIFKYNNTTVSNQYKRVYDVVLNV